MLKVSNLHAAYSTVPVLTGVDCELGKGEVLALLGRNGVGKTTFMKALIGLLRPTDGRVELDGNAIQGLPPHRIARLGMAYVPQGRGIFAKLSVRENLLVGTRAQRDGTGTIPDDVFSYFPILQERLDQAGGTLSGGEQQMLAIARALCGYPEVLLLDEPSEGIQPSIVQELGRIIGRISESSGTSVLLVEQNIDLALETSGRCLVMEKGRIVHEGAPDDLRDEAVSEQVSGDLSYRSVPSMSFARAIPGPELGYASASLSKLGAGDHEHAPRIVVGGAALVHHAHEGNDGGEAAGVEPEPDWLVVVRDIQADRAWNRVERAPQQRHGRLGVLGDERSHLGTGPAIPCQHIAVHTSIALGQECGRRKTAVQVFQQV